MKKIILFISILAFTLGISVFCFATDLPDTTDTTGTYSLSTTYDFKTRIEYDRQTAKIDISGMPSNYVVIPYFRYFTVQVSGKTAYWLNLCTAIYDKNQDITYIPTRSSGDNNFVKTFYDNGSIVLTGINGASSQQGLIFGLGDQNQRFLDLKSNNNRLPYYVTDKFCTSGEYPFSLSDVLNKGTWFVNGNNYPFNNNSVYSSDVYYPLVSQFNGFHDKNSLNYDFTFSISRNNPKYNQLDNYYLEIWTSSELDTKLIFQSTYKLTDCTIHRSYNGEVYYSVNRDFYDIFPNGNPYYNFTVFARLRYVSGDVNLVSSYQYYIQHYYMAEDPKLPKVYQVDDLLPDSKQPDTIEDGSINPDSQVGTYDFGSFNALEFVKGAGGLASLTQGVSTVFSFLPPWLWQMMWYVLGALAVIALLKVVIS